MLLLLLMVPNGRIRNGCIFWHIIMQEMKGFQTSCYLALFSSLLWCSTQRKTKLLPVFAVIDWLCPMPDFLPPPVEQWCLTVLSVLLFLMMGVVMLVLVGIGTRGHIQHKKRRGTFVVAAASFGHRIHHSSYALVGLVLFLWSTNCFFNIRQRWKPSCPWLREPQCFPICIVCLCAVCSINVTLPRSEYHCCARALAHCKAIAAAAELMGALCVCA